MLSKPTFGGLTLFNPFLLRESFNWWTRADEVSIPECAINTPCCGPILASHSNDFTWDKTI
jgi:hypothetical protein